MFRESFRRERTLLVAWETPPFILIIHELYIPPPKPTQPAPPSVLNSFFSRHSAVLALISFLVERPRIRYSRTRLSLVPYHQPWLLYSILLCKLPVKKKTTACVNKLCKQDILLLALLLLILFWKTLVCQQQQQQQQSINHEVLIPTVNLSAFTNGNRRLSTTTRRPCPSGDYQ